MADDRRPPSIRLQVLAMGLVALLPVAWLIGRRTAPPTRAIPLLAAPEDSIALVESARGLAAGDALVSLPPPAAGQAAYRLAFRAAPAGHPGRPPYRIRLEGPDGADLWQGASSSGADGPLELVVPAPNLRPGRHAIRIEDAAGIVRSYLFLVPKAEALPAR